MLPLALKKAQMNQNNSENIRSDPGNKLPKQRGKLMILVSYG